MLKRSARPVLTFMVLLLLAGCAAEPIQNKPVLSNTDDLSTPDVVFLDDSIHGDTDTIPDSGNQSSLPEGSKESSLGSKESGSDGDVSLPQQATFGMETADFIQLFVSPMVWLNQVHAEEKETDSAKLSAINLLLSDLGEYLVYGGLTLPGLAPHSVDEDRDEYAFFPEDIVMAARDYCGWIITEDSVTEYYTNLGRYRDGSIHFMNGGGDSFPRPYAVRYSYDGNYLSATTCNLDMGRVFSREMIGKVQIEARAESCFGFTIANYRDEPLITAFSASSSQKDYPEKHVADQSLDTVWVPLTSEDEWIQVDFTDSVSFSGIALYGGYGKTEDLLKKNNRIKRISATFSDGSILTWALPDIESVDESIALKIPDAPSTKFMRFTIEDVYAGSAYNDTCISEMFFIPQTDQSNFSMVTHVVEPE